MLTIKTDLDNINWLIYILEEFKQINLAQFDIEILSLETATDNPNVLYYTKKKIDGISIYNSNKKYTSSDIEYITEKLYILKGTKNKGFSISYDLFWNSFVFLSRYEEFFHPKNIHSYSSNHPRKDKLSFKIAVVNELFNALEEFMKSNFQGLTFGDRQEAIIDLSHDVDYLKKTIQLRIKQTLFNSYNTLKAVKQPKLFINRLLKTASFAFSTPSYWCFDYWQELENKYKKKSTFYVYVKNGKKDFKSWIIDPSYDVSTDKKLQKKLKALIKDGFEIGLHGSYDSALHFEKLKKEKEILENILDTKVTKTRQHWLNYNEKITPFSHNDLFKYDSTLGWNDTIGFRSGCASAYRAYDFNNEKAFKYTIIPQVIMDSNIYDYSVNDTIFNEAKEIITYAKNVSKTTFISLSWHQRVCSNDYNWHKFYEEIIYDI